MAEEFNLATTVINKHFLSQKTTHADGQADLEKIITQQVERYEYWIGMTITSTNGDILYKKYKKHDSHTVIFREDVIVNKELVGLVELSVSPEIYFHSINERTKNAFYYFIFIIFAMICVIFLALEVIVIKPLIRLATSANSIIQGDFDFNLPTSSRDEIGDAAKSFVSMKALLVETNARLHEDNTMAKDMAEALSKSEEKLRSIVSTIEDGIVIIDYTGVIEMCNPAFSRMLGYNENELNMKNISCIMNSEHEARHDLYILNYLIGTSKKIVNQGAREVYAQTKTGYQIPVEISVSDYMVNDKHYFVATLRDISKRKEIERKIKDERNRAQLYLDTAQVAIFSLDPNGYITTANKKSSEIFGFSQSELTKENWFDLIVDSEARELLYELYSLRMQCEDEMLGYFYLRMYNKMKDERILEWYNKVILDEQGNPAGMLFSGFDVTESYKSEIEKNQLRNQLMQTRKMEAIGQLTGGIAHDFNNILACMLGYTELLLEHEAINTDQKSVEYLGVIYDSGERASELIQNMLTYSRGINTVEVKVLYFPGIASDIMAMLSSIIPNGIKIEMDFDRDTPDIICDSISIQEIIINLCNNAREAMKNKGLLSLSTSDAESVNADCASCGKPFSGHYVELCVKDTGPGISEVNLLHLFEPFFSTKAVGKGNGMGLSVIHGILHEIGAHILINTIPNQGTTVKIYFPVADEAQDSIPYNSNTTQAASL